MSSVVLPLVRLHGAYDLDPTTQFVGIAATSQVSLYLLPTWFKLGNPDKGPVRFLITKTPKGIFLVLVD
jgi:hypothetical protein